MKVLLKIRKSENDLVQTKRKYIKNHMVINFKLISVDDFWVGCNVDAPVNL